MGGLLSGLALQLPSPPFKKEERESKGYFIWDT